MNLVYRFQGWCTEEGRGDADVIGEVLAPNHAEAVEMVELLVSTPECQRWEVEKMGYRYESGHPRILCWEAT